MLLNTLLMSFYPPTPLSGGETSHDPSLAKSLRAPLLMSYSDGQWTKDILDGHDISLPPFRKEETSLKCFKQ